MRKQLYLITCLLITGCIFYIMSCNSSEDKKADTTDVTPVESKTMSQEELIKRGEYIVTTGSCNDCHSPKIMTGMGPVTDTTKLLSGHPAGSKLPPLDASAVKPGGWILMTGDITAFVGPWGISYAANLTPDSTTGIGAWSEETFVNAIRTGKHLGSAGGRMILPPMPWPDIAKKTDEDLKAIYTYLKSLPAIKNQVPAPVAPPDVMKMK